MRSIPFYPLMVLLLVGLGGYLGCDPNSIQPSSDPGTQFASTTAQYTGSIPQRTAGTLLVGSFNMQRLGPTKLGDSWVMERFADIIRRFDLIALQEITSKDQNTLPILLDYVNRQGGRYAFVISPRIGRASTGYYEQYAYIYDTTRIRGGSEFSYVVQDEADYLHREPHVGRFEAVGVEKPFSFTLVNIHTDPDEIATELNVLADVYRSVRQFEYPEDDVILLGDLNAAPGKLQKLEEIPGLVALIDGLPTNTRKNRTLDNILVDSQTTREFTGRAGTIDLENMFGVDRDQAERISDHLPIWAEFRISEHQGGYGGVATAPTSNSLR